MTWLLACCIALGSSSGKTITKVDMLELNHVIRDDGSEFVQWILWDWNSHLRTFVVVDWRTWSCEDVYRMRTDCRYEIAWRPFGTDAPIVQAKIFRETITRRDPEVENRKIWELGARRQLW